MRLPFVLTVITKRLLITVLLTVITDRSGFQAECSSVRDPGITGLNTFMDTSITLLTFATDIEGRCPHGMKLLLVSERRSTAKPCMILAATRLRVTANR